MQDLRAAIGRVLLVGEPGGNHERHSDVLNVSDEAGLLARVAEALLPVHEPDTAEPVLLFDGYRLDRAGHSLLDAAGREVRLTYGEFGLLRVFVQRAGRVLSRDQLLQLLSGRGAETFDRSIDMQVVRLRRKIEKDPKRPILIVTIPNMGYKFTAQVRQEEAPAPPEPKSATAPPEARPVGAERRFVTALAGEVLAAEGSRLPDDPEELSALIDGYRSYAATIVALHGGVLAGRRQREVLAYFGYPVAQEHAAERAVHASGMALAKHLPCGEDGASGRAGGPDRRLERSRGRRARWRGAWRGASGGRTATESCRARPGHH